MDMRSLATYAECNNMHKLLLPLSITFIYTHLNMEDNSCQRNLVRLLNCLESAAVMLQYQSQHERRWDRKP